MKTKIIKGNSLGLPSEAEIESLNRLILTSARPDDKWSHITKVIKQKNYFWTITDKCSMVLKIE